MLILETLLWGGLGLIFGSFANVVILRYGKKSIGGRSVCPACGTTLKWYELLPVLSWLALRGKCGTCSARISIQYPIVEMLMATGFLAVGLAPSPLLVQVLGAAIVFLFVVIAVYDTYTMLMPDQWVFSFAALALASSAYALFVSGTEWTPILILLAAGPAVALPLFCMWYFSDGAWMGFGDVKFSLGIGWLLGTAYGLLALVYAFILGAVVGLFLLSIPRLLVALRKIGITSFQEGGTGFTMKSEVPFGPFLILGTSIIWLATLYSYEPALTLLGDLVL
ncbi:MAG: prepilin peptidase [Minisyncoccia bacterium]